MSTWKHRMRRWFGFLFVSCSLAMFAGCPSSGPTPADGGNNPDTEVADQQTPLTCEPGVLCLIVGNENARSCDILLKSDKEISSPQVDFAANTIGQSKYRDSRLALSFLVQKDEAFGNTNSVVLIKPGENAGQFEIGQATCYDRNGNAVDKADISLRRP